MKTTPAKQSHPKAAHVDHVLAGLEAKPHPAGNRHQAMPHHWSAALILAVVTVILFVLVIISVGQSGSGQSYHPPTIPVANEASTTLTNITTDYNQINVDDLSDANLTK